MSLGGALHEVGRVLAAPDLPELPLARLPHFSYWTTLMNYAPFKALLPIPIFAALAPAMYWFFHKTWRDIDRESAASRAHMAEETDYRPAVCFVIVAIVLTLQEYYGGRGFYDQHIQPAIEELNWGPVGRARLAKYDELWGYAWWSFSRFAGYVLFPLPLWKLLFPKDSLLDMGLRFRGFISHAWIYGLFLLIVVPPMLIVAREPDFGGYYPFYKLSSRSYVDWLGWELMYFVQFFALELFFRGFMLAALRRTLGSAAIFAMALPYCMIHYGKPYLEAHGAVVAGIALGSLAMRTRSIYGGFLVHVTVAFVMDFLALSHRSALPSVLFPP